MFHKVKGQLKKKLRGPVAETPADSSPPNGTPNIKSVSSSHSDSKKISIELTAEPAPSEIAKGSGADGDRKYLETFISLLDKSASVFGPLKSAMNNLLKAVQAYEDVLSAREGYQEIQRDIESIVNDLAGYFTKSTYTPLQMTESMIGICHAMEQELRQISHKQDRTIMTQYVNVERDINDILERYRRVQTLLQRFLMNTNLEIWRVVDEQGIEDRLGKIGSALSARYNSAEAAIVHRRDCTPETRKRVIADAQNWLQDNQSGKLFWLSGMAGTGKTTIANTLCGLLDGQRQLGASFFCTRLLPECRSPKLILPSIAHQLSRFSYPFRSSLARVLESNPDVHTQAIRIQFKRMIFDPLQEVAGSLPPDMLIVIDALDECDEPENAIQVLEMLITYASDLPTKFFVSSRSEPQIRRAMAGLNSRMVLHELDDKVVKEDIRVYFRTELAYMSLSEQQISAMVERAGVLFIYAATAVRYIGARKNSVDAKKRLDIVLGVSGPTVSTKDKEIDSLYNAILASAFDDPDLEFWERDRMNNVLHTVICAQEPLTISALARFLEVDESEVRVAVDPLWSVLHVSEDNELIGTLHASFVDYILDSERSKKYTCDASIRHGQLARLCFNRIRKNKSQFNICNLESSYFPDKLVPNIEERVKQAIPLELSYACMYWAVHLELGKDPNAYSEELRDFLSNRLLLWVEILNLTKTMKSGSSLLDRVRSRWEMSDAPASIKALIYDAWRFVTMFATSPVSHSTAHIYVSMLASWPKSRPLAGLYLPRTSGLISLSGVGMTRRRLALLGVLKEPETISSIAYSHDGVYFASGSYDKTIRVWGTHTGKLAIGPLVGHTNRISALKFTPDGTHIISSSRTELLAWDLKTGQLTLLLDWPTVGIKDGAVSLGLSSDGKSIAAACGAHACICNLGENQAISNLHILDTWEEPNLLLGNHAVSFSADDAYIVAGRGSTVCVYSIEDEKITLGPLQGHTKLVASVVFSPDGKRIASGSHDKTIRLWSASSGKMICNPIFGHLASVVSVVFTPDGTCIVSGSHDMTVCVWDTITGQLIAGPFEGHTDTITSMAISPDGCRIISGSTDQTIRIWDPFSEKADGNMSTNAAPLAFSSDSTLSASHIRFTNLLLVRDIPSGQKPTQFNGSSERISAIAISPDNTLLACGSWDNTICIWDLQTGQMLAGPLKEHTDSISSIGFSPDSTRIVSSSWDGTLQIRESRTGDPIGSFLGRQGENNGVITSAFSPFGVLIVAGYWNGAVCVWDGPKGQPALESLQRHKKSVTSVVYNHNGTKIASGAMDTNIFISDAATGQLLIGPLEHHTDEVNCIVFTPDGGLLVSGSRDTSVIVWDSQSGDVVFGPLWGHTGAIKAISVSPDRNTILSASSDRSIRMWNARCEIRRQATPETESSAPCWKLTGEGWAIDAYDRLLLWVPPDLRDVLVRPPHNYGVISDRGSIEIEFKDACIGGEWHKCYRPS